MSLEKYADVLELSVKQFVMQSSPSSLGQIIKMLMLLVTKLVIFLYRTRLMLE